MLKLKIDRMRIQNSGAELQGQEQQTVVSCFTFCYSRAVQIWCLSQSACMGINDTANVFGK
jgi:hypothetical protein